MKGIYILSVFLLVLAVTASAQRVVPKQDKEVRKAQKKTDRQGGEPKTQAVEDRWNPRKIPGKSMGVPEISAWHTGTAGIIPSDAAEVSLFNPTRIGFTRKTELLFRIAEEPFLPNFGLKHRWWGNSRWIFSSEHTLYYTFPLLKILQNTGFKDLVPDSLNVGQGMAMRNELLLSWLINPRVFGCPEQTPERILTLRAGFEFGIGGGEVKPFDYFHSFYHTQIFDRKLLYHAGLQFDSYFLHRFHYGVNALFYDVDFSRNYAVEANLRLTYYISRRIGISASVKGAYMNLYDRKGFACLPLLDLTYLVNPGRGAINHGLYKNSRRRR